MADQLLKRNIALLSNISDEEIKVMPCHNRQLPSVQALKKIVGLVRDIVFPAYFDDKQGDVFYREYHIGVNVERLSMASTAAISLSAPISTATATGPSRVTTEKAHGLQRRLRPQPNAQM